MSNETDVREYTSPLRKLVTFFKKSRDKWKRKCQAAKDQNKLLKNQTRAVEQSRDQWNELARERAKRITELERELELEKTNSGRPLNWPRSPPARPWAAPVITTSASRKSACS